MCIRDRWKGGKTKCNGYWRLYIPNHPFAKEGYVKQARYLIEREIGRYLNSKEEVHHINGIRDDDRIENLIILSKSSHLSLHHKQIVIKQKRNNLGRFIKEVMSNEISAMG